MFLIVLQVDFVTRHWPYDVLFLLMAAGQDSQYDFAPAWLKLPSQDALVFSQNCAIIIIIESLLVQSILVC